MDAAATALELAEISKQFVGLSVLRDVRLKVNFGDRLGIIGQNGAGKSTMLRLIGGWIKPDNGLLRMFGKDITTWPIFRRYAFGLREVPQFPEISSELTGHETIAVGQLALAFSQGHFGSNLSNIQGNDITNITERLVSESDLSSHLDSLSFGSQKMIAIAAVLASSPRILLLDEPTAGLDKTQRDNLLRVLVELEERCAVIIVEHDLSFLYNACNRLVELRDGVLITVRDDRFNNISRE